MKLRSAGQYAAKKVRPCPGCGKERAVCARGLCSACYVRHRRRGTIGAFPPAPPDPAGRKPKPPCRHCHAGAVVRPRGLCWKCYYAPGVRDLYPVTSKFADPEVRDLGDDANALTDAEILALPAQPFGDEDAPPPFVDKPTRGEQSGQKCGRLAGPTWDRWPGTRGAGRLDLHPDTEPEAIEAAQRRDVRAAREHLGPAATVKAVSEATCLPTWNVERHWG